ELDDKQIPGRTKVGDLISEAYAREYQRLIDRLASSLGRIALTSDIWSRQNMEGYMAVTAHYL
ncbi:hypothetical protein CYLTODRAFT_331722, partial [Cylindrobasidium torrendii FP15055 ss-10]